MRATLPNRSALLLIDIQNDFLPGGTLAVADGDAIIAPINTLLANVSFCWVVASKDWHPADHCSFASVHNEEVGEKVEIEGILQQLWPEHCMAGSNGAAHPNTLATAAIETTIYKGMDRNIDSYSAFFDNDHRNATELAAELRSRAIESLYVAGLTTDYFGILCPRRLDARICRDTPCRLLQGGKRGKRG